METYVVRIYRRARGAVAGVVESTDGAASRPFKSLDELRALLAMPLVRVPRVRRVTRASPRGDGAKRP